MTDMVEMTDTVVDAHGYELRPGDEVESIFEIDGEALKGKVLHITRAQGKVVGDPSMGQVSAEVPPEVTVQFDNGTQISFGPSFLRLNMWRWNCLDVKRA